MNYALIVLFYINGSYVFAEGFLPKMFDNHETCEAARVYADNYFKAQSGVPQYTLHCYQQLKDGSLS